MQQEKEKNKFDQQKESSFKRGNGRDPNAQKQAETSQRERKGERKNDLQEYENDQEADVKGG